MSRSQHSSLAFIGLVLSSVLAGFLWSCGGSQSVAPVPPAPPMETSATLAGPLCEGARCECSRDPSRIQAADSGFKRFRIELGPSESELWLSVGNDTMYKSVERANSCFYLDVPSGEHRLSLRARGKGGFGAGLTIAEVDRDAQWLFETFDFNCGAPGLCSKQALSDWRDSVGGVEDGKFAPCGSVRINDVNWITGKAPDRLHPEEFVLSATMKVYKFAPKSPPGSEDCSKSAAN